MADKVTTSLAEAKILVMKGQAGFSPQIEVTDIEGGHQIRITTKISDTQYREDVFNVMDGEQGEPGEPGEPGSPGAPGAPGVSPTVSVQDITEPIPGGTKVIGHTVTITDATGANSFNVMNGEDGEGGGGSYNPDEELAKSFQLTVSGTTVTLNDTAVNVSAAIQSARPVLFYTVSGGSFTFFGVSGMDYETGEIRLTTLFDGSGQTVTLAPSGSTMTGTLENVSGGSELPTVTAADNGKFLRVSNGEWAAQAVPFQTPRVAMAASDTTPTLDPNKLYVFPEMVSLAPTLATPSDATIVNEYHFCFDSGATATVLTLPASVLQPDGFTVEANMHYEISILEGAMTAQGWAVGA